MAFETPSPTSGRVATDARVAPAGADRLRGRKVALYVVAYNAVHSLSGVLDRIPAPVRDGVSEIFVCDAGSRDDTYLVGVGYQSVSGIEKLNIIQGSGEGFGRNHKWALDHCLERKYDVVVWLHADGKYAPEVIERFIDPLVRGEVDAVHGSRFLEGNPSRRGMPFHKYVAIRLLSALQNHLLGLQLSEYHCGYQAYSVPALAGLPYRENSDALVFDTELTIQMRLAGLRVTEVPVPVYSGSETDSVRGVGYLLQVLRVLAQYWLHSRGIREYPKFDVVERYAYKEAPDASHQKVLGLVDRDRQSILDVGCGAGYLGEALAVRGNRVVGVDSRRVPGVEGRVERFLQVDLDREEIPAAGEPFDFVLLADVLEHLADPRRVLSRCRELLAHDGRLVVSVPNVAHWSVRLPLLFGRFDYTARGILDRTHLRFYTLSSIRRELEGLGFEVEQFEATSPPFDALLGGGERSRAAALLAWTSRLGIRLWRELFAYQFVLRARKRAA